MLVDLILSSTGDAVEAHLKHHYSDKVAKQCVRALIKLLHLNFNKYGRFYVPTNGHTPTDERYAAIYKEFTGHNQKELAIKFRISMQTVYVAIRKHRSKTPAKQKNAILTDVLNDQFSVELINLGVSKEHAQACSAFVIDYLIKNFPGVQLTITDNAWKRWSFSQIKQKATTTHSD